jgi:hypothetical protein
MGNDENGPNAEEICVYSKPVFPLSCDASRIEPCPTTFEIPEAEGRSWSASRSRPTSSGTFNAPPARWLERPFATCSITPHLRHRLSPLRGHRQPRSTPRLRLHDGLALDLREPGRHMALTFRASSTGLLCQVHELIGQRSTALSLARHSSAIDTTSPRQQAARRRSGRDEETTVQERPRTAYRRSLSHRRR